ncbi:MAG: choice-of-anchor E domain-containing protein, partial [Planctomycetes bacterium]|nr:choice-of-anchor E domain-containing protein [Planctomycetota bacterium]
MFGSYRFAPFVLACLPALGLTSAAEAQTQTVCFTGSVPLQSTNWTSSVTVPKFNPALGTLQQVTFRLDGHVEGSASVESLDTSATVVQLLYAASITLQRPDATVIVTGMPNTMFTDSLGPFDGVIDFGGPSGASHLGISINSTDNATSPPPASDLVLFSGAGTITLPINGVGLSQAVGSGNVITQFITRASAVVQVCYIYAPCACTSAPVISGCTPGSVDLGCNPTSIPGCTSGVTAADNCEPVPVTCSVSDTSNGCVNTRVVTYSATNACGTTTCSRTYTWTVDTTPPTFDNCVSGNTDLGCNPTNLPVCDPGVTASDNCGPATVTCTSSDVVNGCVTTRTLVYTARDACNNTTTCARTFTWTTDTTPP